MRSRLPRATGVATLKRLLRHAFTRPYGDRRKVSLIRITVVIAVVAIWAAGVAVAAKDIYAKTHHLVSVGLMHGGESNKSSGHHAKESPRPKSTNAARSGENAAFATSRRQAAEQLDRARAEQRADRHQRGTLPWTLPVRGYHLSARFGQNGDNWRSFHHGLDFAAPEGTPVHSVGAGEIVDVTRGDPAYGNYLKVRYDGGTVALYGHLSAFERTSGKVDAGTVIGYVGSTGNATGPHLHLEVRPHGGDLHSAIDPFPWLSDKGLYP
jgi:murein DD-endopeptidase MepM/ murein hydrolase activator NlpD